MAQFHTKLPQAESKVDNQPKHREPERKASEEEKSYQSNPQAASFELEKRPDLCVTSCAPEGQNTKAATLSFSLAAQRWC
jgi:hypothetical protein